MSSSVEDEDKKCWISYIDGHDLLTHQNSGLERNKLLVRGYSRQHSSFIPIALSGLCYQFYFDERLSAVTVNTIDMGYKSIMRRHKLIYKDTMYKSLLREWSLETDIPLHHLSVYNYTGRRNKTMRTNVQIKVDLNEAFQGDGDWTDDEIKRHLVLTSPTMKRISSIYHRIGNIMEKKRSFVLLDDRKIMTLEGPKSEKYARTILVALKYFDILEQKLYFVDWLRLKTTSITFADISKYIESKLIPNTMADGGCLQSLHDLNMKMSEFEAKSNGDEQPEYQFYEEEASYLKGNSTDSVLKCNRFNSEDAVDESFYNGDIFVFQINPFHPYFSTLDPAEIDTQVSTIEGDQQQQPLPSYWKCKPLEFEEKGIFWYRAFDKFMQAQVRMIDFEIQMRGTSEWRRQHESVEANRAKKNHKWTIDPTTTFAMIRKRLGSYYNFEAKHIEIWYYFGGDDDTVTEQVMEWNTTVAGLMEELHWFGPLGTFHFDIVAYNVKDRDQMETQHLEDPDSVDVAPFRLSVHLPLRHGVPSECRTIEVIRGRNWRAKELIQSILDQLIGEPVLLSLYFGHIAEYIRKYEMEDVEQTDVEILRNLDPCRFLITEDFTSERHEKYYKRDVFDFPSDHAQIVFFDLAVQFFALYDPLLNAVNHKEDSNTFAIWVHFYRHGNDTNLIGLTKVVIKEGESFKDMILRDILHYLALEEQCFDLEDDNIFKAITDSHTFQLRRFDGLKVTLTVEHLIRRRDLSDSMVDDMCVVLPPASS